jgi:hypothetical protein
VEVLLIAMRWITATTASQPAVASVQARLVLAGLFIVLGTVLAFDVRGLASRLHRANSGFTPWGRKLVDRIPFNPARVVGAVFLAGGLVALVSVALNP